MATGDLPSENLSGSLRAAGLRVTRQRLAVMAALARHSDAITAQELHHELRSQRPAPGLATVYRTLTALAEAGEVDTFRREGEQSFRLCGPDHHHHLVCESCGSVREVGAEEVESWVGRVASEHGFRVTGHRADVFGICRRCLM